MLSPGVEARNRAATERLGFAGKAKSVLSNFVNVPFADVISCFESDPAYCHPFLTVSPEIICAEVDGSVYC